MNQKEKTMTNEKKDLGLTVMHIVRVEVGSISVQSSDVEADSFDFFDEATDADGPDLLFTISWEKFEALYVAIKEERGRFQDK